MKKLIALLSLLVLATVAQAQEKITILYAFSPSDTTGNFSRILSAEANKLQNKYEFIYDAKPGAGTLTKKSA